jgi:hypothetical protein
MGYARRRAMKNILFIAGPKNGAFVNTRLSTMHHSAEPRIGFAETAFACLVVVALVGFAFVITH